MVTGHASEENAMFMIPNPGHGDNVHTRVTVTMSTQLVTILTIATYKYNFQSYRFTGNPGHTEANNTESARSNLCSEFDHVFNYSLQIFQIYHKKTFSHLSSVAMTTCRPMSLGCMTVKR